MRVLGISPLDKDATASFMEDGRVVFACGEERLSRVKLQDGFPHRAVQMGFDRTGWDPGSIDVVAYAFFDGDEEARLIRESLAIDEQMHASTATAESLRRMREAMRGYRVDRSVAIHGIDDEEHEFVPPKPPAKRLVYDLVSRFARLDYRAHRRFLKKWEREAVADHQRRTRQLAEGLAQYGLAGKLRRFNHHDTHAANAFFASGFDEALLVTFDGYGSGNCGGIYRGGSDGIECLHRYRFPNSLGVFYEFVTSGLGFKAGRHEGKIVGLAAYGNPEILTPALLERFECREGDIVMRASQNYFFTRGLAQHFAKRDVAAAYQTALERVGAQSVAWWLAKTGLKKIAVSGGVHANVKFNQRLREVSGVEQVFVYPNMGDGGCATGAAMLAFQASGTRECAGASAVEAPKVRDSIAQRETLGSEAQFNVKPQPGATPMIERDDLGRPSSSIHRPHPSPLPKGEGAAALRAIDNAYYGPDYTDEEIEAELDREGLGFERSEAIEEEVVRLLCQNRIVGRFAGRMEYGPRALGNRSILYPAHDPDVNQWLNHQLGRTEFMPFAPAALASEAHRLFKNLEGCEKAAEFMTITFDCTEEMKQKCPAAVHVDGTARPQLVSERTNASFHRILRGYYEATGVAALINTSFNMHEEPIVCSPRDAIRAFLQGRLDYLAIGPYLVPHPRLAEISREREAVAVQA